MTPNLTFMEVSVGVREEVVLDKSHLEDNIAVMLLLVKCYDKK